MTRPSNRFLGVGIVVLLLLVTFVGLYGVARYKRAQQSTAGDGAIAVVIDAKGCQSPDFKVQAGRNVFEIENRSDRAVEWEILNGVMVVAERENIAPGFKQRLTVRLEPGHYEITCGLLSNPRGTLVASETDASRAAATKGPDLRDLLGPTAEYQVGLGMAAADLLEATTNLAQAVAAGDLEAARNLYAPARLAYARLEPSADLFGDLANKIDVQADYFAQREADPAFIGFHRLEYGLFKTGSLDGLAAVAQQLQADVQSLNDRILDLAVTPASMVNGPASLLDKILGGRLDGTGERYSGLYLVDLQGNLMGIRRAVELLAPALKSAKDLPPLLLADIDAARALIPTDGDGPTSATKLDEKARADLKTSLTKLTADFGRLRGALGMD
ncbi:iron uptake system component EfeO [Arboricoccus pini]|uniref:Iron uptake system component EfeO n=1 Tax=Arboricoccus pini TaxID=1963835 RepID=A0A212RBR1_9PROT|nr:iron uptake system protein EfeO [Arboricoccus pini]SNB69657.1 iron uptake system component EfeO [Arboricoccus pini]